MAKANKDTAWGEFRFYKEMNQGNVATTMIEISNWSMNNRGQPFRVLTDCGGGNISDALAFAAEIAHFRTLGHFTEIVIYGKDSSCGAWVSQVFDRRVINVESTLMYHKVIPTRCRTFNELEAEYFRCKDLQAQTDRLFLHRLDPKILNASKLHAKIDKSDWVITAKQALKLGLVDAIEYAPPYRKLEDL